MNITRVRSLPRFASLLALAVLAPTAAARQCASDAFEPNDDCSQATPVGVGVLTGLTSSSSEDDVFRIDVPAGQRLEVRVNASAPGDLFGLLRLAGEEVGAPPCANFDDELVTACFAGSGTSASMFAWSSSSNHATRFYVSIQTLSAACAQYELDLRIVPEPCAAVAPDALEGNDSCATAQPLALGLHLALSASLGDPDFYRVTVQPGELLTVGVRGVPVGESASLWAWDANGPCGSTANISHGAAIWGGSINGVSLFNPGAAPKDYILELEPGADPFAQTGFCVDYELELQAQFNPCGLLTPDAFEPNNFCGAPAPLSTSQAGLSISVGDPDWYELSVPPRSSVRVLSTSTTAIKSRAMMLHSGCSASSSDFLASSWNVYYDSLDPRQFLSWTNSGPQAVSARLLVIAPHGAVLGSFCDTYDLDLGFTLGAPFCPLKRNSTGEGARLSASGSTQPGVGLLEFSATPLPANKAGLLIMSRSQGAPTPLSKGYLCLSAPIVRHPVTTTAAGTLVSTLDWSGASAQIALGDTWNFQVWHRDPAAAGGSNLSDGLSLEFQ